MTTTVLPAASAPALEVARALGDPLRWRMVELLAGEQLCVAHLTEELGVGQPVEVVRRIRDDIDARVQQLLAELVPTGA